MLCIPTSIFVCFDISFIYSKTTLEISSKTNILFQAVLTGYRIDVITITLKDLPRIMSSIGNTACQITHLLQLVTEIALLTLLLGYKDGANNSLND